MALGSTGAVSTPHALASDAALATLEAGGNAVDAAVAAAAVATVVQPWSSSIGGVGWCSVFDATTGTADVLDYHGIVPPGLDPGVLPAGDGGMVDWPRLEGQHGSLLGSLVPGTVPGWEELIRRRGRWPFRRVLEPAIAVAAEGFPVSEALHAMVVANQERLARWPQSARLYLPAGRPCRIGERLVQTDLAHTLERVAANGADELRSGRTAAVIAGFYADHGGAVSAGDLAAYTPSWCPALVVPFRDHLVLCAPGSLGDVGFALGLRLLDAFPPCTSPSDPAYVHLSVESARLVADQRERLLGPMSPPDIADTLLSTPNLATLKRSIGERAWPGRGPGRTPEDTITLAVVDGEGTAVNLMQTVGTYFGSAAIAGDTGVLLNTSLYFGTPLNQWANGIVPGHGIEQNPCLATVLDATGSLRLVVGSPGGRTRVETVRQMIANVIDFGLNVQQAVDAPRFLAHPAGVGIDFERRYGPIEAGLRSRLEALGHVVRDHGDAAGSGQAVAVDPTTRVRMAAADWRRESVARAY
jgi:gamma-glutamyltranspeptidase/glutathione hydrolase